MNDRTPGRALPPAGPHPSAPRRVLDLLLVALGVAVPVLAMVAVEDTASTDDLHERAGDCVLCQTLVRDAVTQGGQDTDPHQVECAVCHHPHEEIEPSEWRHRAQTPACHPQAWTETVYHRLPPATFKTCTNCHKPHTWKANGDDCMSCHEEIHGPRGLVEVVSLRDAGSFDHGRHRDFECARCHESRQRHASLTLTSGRECQACHHAKSEGADCESCHRWEDLVGVRSVSMVVRLANVESTRELPFDHLIHEGLDCADCHTSRSDVFQVAACSSCHEYHHDVDAACSTCHEPPPADAHPTSIHVTSCSDASCHGPEWPADVPRKRNICLSCHVEQVDHNPQKDCRSCHLLGGDLHGAGAP